jgi:hypothetical protein
MEDQELLTANEAARRLGISRASLYGWLGHAVMSPVLDNQVRVFQIPAGFAPQGILSQMKHQHREEDIFKYSYFTLSDERLHSVWLLTFFENRHFAAYVSLEVNGFARAQ